MVKPWVTHPLWVSSAYSAAVVQSVGTQGGAEAPNTRRANLQLWVKLDMYNGKEGEAASCGQVCILSPPDGEWWLTRNLFFKTISSFRPPPPHLGNHPEAVATGTPLSLTTSHCMKQESRSARNGTEVWPLLQSGCCPSSSPDFLVAVLNLSSVEHSCHREASTFWFAWVKRLRKSGNPGESKEPCTASPEVLTPWGSRGQVPVSSTHLPS